MSTSAVDILFEAEALRGEAKQRTVAVLPVANGAVQCLSQLINSEHPLTWSSECRKLLVTASGAYCDFRVKSSIAHDPFKIFWGNPDEPAHSRLLAYFIKPRAEHGCGPFLLSGLLRALKVSDSELPVDEHCEVTCEKGHIDLLVTRDGDDGKYALIIENKVNGAPDQPRQLQRYYEDVRRRGFKDEEIFPCYLPLRRGRRPSDDSAGSLLKRLRPTSFEEQIVPWLEGVLDDKGKWPANMSEGMCDNLKHYLDLIKWRLNQEKVMQMNERIFDALQAADKENRLSTFGEITALRESAQALEECYRRLMRAKTFAAVRRLLEERGLKATHAYHDGWSEPTWYDDLLSQEHFFGFSVGDITIVAFGEDPKGMYTGYAIMPERKGEEVGLFGEFVRKEDPSAFAGQSNPYWYSYNYYVQNDRARPEDGTRPQDVARLADNVLEMHRTMKHLVDKFRASGVGRRVRTPKPVP
jgi:hypothetical protein